MPISAVCVRNNDGSFTSGLGCAAVEWHWMQLAFQSCTGAGSFGSIRKVSFRGSQRSSSNKYENGKLSCKLPCLLGTQYACIWCDPVVSPRRLQTRIG